MMDAVIYGITPQCEDCGIIESATSEHVDKTEQVISAAILGRLVESSRYNTGSTTKVPTR
jgi:hypothetical protein